MGSLCGVTANNNRCCDIQSTPDDDKYRMINKTEMSDKIQHNLNHDRISLARGQENSVRHFPQTVVHKCTEYIHFRNVRREQKARLHVTFIKGRLRVRFGPHFLTGLRIVTV